MIPDYKRKEAKQLEWNGKWLEAKKIWASYGCVEDVKAVDSIIESNEKGDRFRCLLERYQELGLSEEEGLDIAYKQVYGS
jgi:hypothetical protein